MFLPHWNGGNSVRCEYQRVRILGGGNRFLLPRKEATLFYKNIIATKGIFVLCVMNGTGKETVETFTPEQAITGPRRTVSRWGEVNQQGQRNSSGGEAGRGQGPGVPWELMRPCGQWEATEQHPCSWSRNHNRMSPGRTPPLTTHFPAVSKVSGSQVISCFIKNS